jgi:hypothetical protein
MSYFPFPCFKYTWIFIFPRFATSLDLTLKLLKSDIPEW